MSFISFFLIFQRSPSFMGPCIFLIVFLSNILSMFVSSMVIVPSLCPEVSIINVQLHGKQSLNTNAYISVDGSGSVTAFLVIKSMYVVQYSRLSYGLHISDVVYLLSWSFLTLVMFGSCRGGDEIKVLLSFFLSSYYNILQVFCIFLPFCLSSPRNFCYFFVSCVFFSFSLLHSLTEETEA